MKNTTKVAREEIKALIIAKGINNILCGDIVKISDRTGLTIAELHNALNYFTYSPKTAKYR